MDFIAPIRVVVVDDKPTHLISIANGLTLAGIPCVGHWYDPKENRLVPPPPEGGYPHLRLLFTDLNIREMNAANSDIKTLAGILISDVLQPIVPPAGGPYSVVLWTNVEGKAAEVGTVIKERIDADQVDAAEKRPQPLAVTTLPKREFLVGIDDDVDIQMSALLKSMAGNAEKLKALVKTAASEDAQLQVACAWESRASMAASETIGSIYQAAAIESKYAKATPSESFRNILSRIAVDALGKRNAVADPTRALDDGLIDIFVDDMRSSESDQDYLGLVKRALDGPLAAIPSKLSPGVRNTLNTFLQIEMPPKQSIQIARGAVLSIPEGILFHGTQLTRKQLLWDEFLFSTRDLEDEIDRRKEAGYSDDLLKELRSKLEFCKVNKTRVEAEAKIVVLEIGADCDHAQRKQRTVRLLWALEVPLDLATFIHPWDDEKRLKHDALLQFGPWLVENREVMLVVSVKRFGIQQSWARADHMEIQYRLRKPLVDLVLHRYSSHSTRPGIMEITG